MDTKIDLKQQPNVSCEKCGSKIFKEVFILKKVSRIMLGEAQDAIAPIGVYCCNICNHINKEFNILDTEESNDKENTPLLGLTP